MDKIVTETPETKKDIFLVTKRYVYREKGKDYVSVRIACETPETHNQITSQLVADDNIESCCVEYLNEYNVSKIGIIIPIKQKEDE